RTGVAQCAGREEAEANGHIQQQNRPERTALTFIRILWQHFSHQVRLRSCWPLDPGGLICLQTQSARSSPEKKQSAAPRIGREAVLIPLVARGSRAACEFMSRRRAGRAGSGPRPQGKRRRL